MTEQLIEASKHCISSQQGHHASQWEITGAETSIAHDKAMRGRLTMADNYMCTLSLTSYTLACSKTTHLAARLALALYTRVLIYRHAYRAI